MWGVYEFVTREGKDYKEYKEYEEVREKRHFQAFLVPFVLFVFFVLFRGEIDRNPKKDYNVLTLPTHIP